MQKIIRNKWFREPGASFERAQILKHEIHPEGLDVDRIRFLEPGGIKLSSNGGNIISILKGTAKLTLEKQHGEPFELEKGVHLYIPPGEESLFEAVSETEILRVASPSPSQARGKKLLIRNEAFLSACTSVSQSYRWILTPQYLSRRIFLYHDQILLSKSGNPVSWFRTTMFDVAGLPKNEEGFSVFKMSYNSRTEFNVCYDVKGKARVRMAKHPYRDKGQLWHPWETLDEETTYNLDEVAGGSDEEYFIDEHTGVRQILRNKHEVHIIDGYVTLFCLFDPSPTGAEKHRAGEYSDYEPLSSILGSPKYEVQLQEMAKYDEIVDRLSMAKAIGELSNFSATQIWQEYLQGRTAQIAGEMELKRLLAAEGHGRERVVAQWMQSTIN
jgi:hypothetical protein